MKDKWPAAYKFLKSFTFSADDQIPLIHKIDAEGKDLETVVKEWVDQKRSQMEAADGCGLGRQLIETDVREAGSPQGPAS